MAYYESVTYKLSERTAGKYFAEVTVSSPRQPGVLSEIVFNLPIKNHVNASGEIAKELQSRRIQIRHEGLISKVKN
jgi:hypothetical protein